MNNNSELRDPNVERTLLVAKVTPCLDHIALEGSGIVNPHSIETDLAEYMRNARAVERLALDSLQQNDFTLAS